MTSCSFGDVIVVDFPQTGGIRKRRPALVILDIGDADILLAPITTKERKGGLQTQRLVGKWFAARVVGTDSEDQLFGKK